MVSDSHWLIFFSSLIIESDDTNAVNSIKNKSILSSDGSIVIEVFDLLKSVGGSTYQFIPWLRNKLAHTLTKSFTGIQSDVEWISSIPRFIF